MHDKIHGEGSAESAKVQYGLQISYKAKRIGLHTGTLSRNCATGLQLLHLRSWRCLAYIYFNQKAVAAVACDNKLKICHHIRVG